MKPPPPPLLIPLNSKRKRVFMDPDVIEIPPPQAPAVSRSHSTEQQKNKQIYELSLAPTPVAVYGSAMRHGAMDVFWFSIET